jgi:hypothetical protein
MSPNGFVASPEDVLEGATLHPVGSGRRDGSGEAFHGGAQSDHQADGESYKTASKSEKGRMLDELCALTGWTRRHARTSLLAALQGPAGRARRPRPRSCRTPGPVYEVSGGMLDGEPLRPTDRSARLDSPSVAHHHFSEPPSLSMCRGG